MPWDPKPEPPPIPQASIPQPSLPSAAAGGGNQYSAYNQQAGVQNGAARIKAEPGSEQQFHGLPNGYASNPPMTEGGAVRAQQLTQQYAQARGLSLPGQRPQGAPGQGLTPQQQQQQAQQMYMQQQRQQAAQQQAALQQQQGQPRIKVENDSPQLHQAGFQQRPTNPAYAQTDGADDAIEEWKAIMAERRAHTAITNQHADHMMRNQIEQMSFSLESGLMMTLDELPSSKKRRTQACAGPSNPNWDVIVENGQVDIPNLDGELGREDEKDVKDEDDENAINSDLDSDEDPTGELDDDDEDFGDSILCTYDKVQRVKNKWKCTLKDGVLSVGRKEHLFHKGTGEFEW